jgi:hypothetical protein
MSDTSELDRAIMGAIARLEAAGSLSALSPVDQTILVVHGAQGVIDNGGLQYFFESDWPDHPAYSSFSEAYRRIGATAAADRLDRAVAMFGFPDPHLFEERRQLRLEHLRKDAAWNDLDSQLCGDVTIWEKLEEYSRVQGVAE